MSDTIDLIWAKLPTFRKHHYEASNDALVAFSGFIPKAIFSYIKSYWEGYILYQGKRTALYRIDVIEALLKETYMVNLSGVTFNKSVDLIPGRSVINKIINLSLESEDPVVKSMSNKQRQLLIYSQVKKDLWALFLASDVVFDLSPFDQKNWTSVQATSNERQYDFDLSQGILHYVEVTRSAGKEERYDRIAHLKDKNDLPTLFKLVMEFKKYGKQADEFEQLEFKSQWNDGFDMNTFETKSQLFQAKAQQALETNTNQSEQTLTPSHDSTSNHSSQSHQEEFAKDMSYDDYLKSSVED